MKKKKKYKTNPTLKQKKAIRNAVENGGNISRAMREAGYSKATAKNPDKLTDSSAFQQFLDEQGLTDKALSKPIRRGLEAKKIQSCNVYVKKDKDGKYKINENSDDFIEVEDMPVQLRAAELGFKLRGRFTDKLEIDANLKGGVDIDVGVSKATLKAIAEAIVKAKNSPGSI